MFGLKYNWTKNWNVRGFLKKNKHNVIFTILFTTSTFMLFDMAVIEADLSRERTLDISCQLIYDNYSLPMLRDNQSLPIMSLFLIESACVNNITERQLCTIESAAESNPTWQINVIFSGMTFQTKKLTPVENSKNIVWKISVEEFSKETSLEELVNSGVLKRCRWNIIRTLDSSSPQTIKDILQCLCSTPDTKFMSSATCNGEIINRNATYYVGGVTKEHKTKKTSLISKLAKEYYPKTNVLYSTYFSL